MRARCETVWRIARRARAVTLGPATVGVRFVGASSIAVAWAIPVGLLVWRTEVALAMPGLLIDARVACVASLALPLLCVCFALRSRRSTIAVDAIVAHVVVALSIR
jgi:hypothetical protein